MITGQQRSRNPNALSNVLHQTFTHHLWLLSLEPRPLAHQSSILPLSQNVPTQAGRAGVTPLHSSPFSWEPGILIDKTSQVTTQPIPRSGKPTPMAIESTIPYQPQPHPQLRCAYEPTLLTPNVVTVPSLEPMTSCISVQHSTTKQKVWTQARGCHCTTHSKIVPHKGQP